MKVLFRELKFFFIDHRWRYVFILVTMVLSSLSLVVPARVIGQIVDGIVGGTLTQTLLITYLIQFFVALVASFFFEALWTYYVFMGSYQMQRIFRLRLLKQLLVKRLPFYAHFRTGDLVTRASEDVRTMGIMTGYGFYGTFNSLMVLTVIIGTMITTVSWKLAVASLIPMPFFAYLILIIGRKDVETFEQAQAAVSELNNHVLEMIDGTYVVRAFGQEERMTRIFRDKTKEALDKNIISAMIETAYMPLCGIVMAISLLVGIFYGALLVERGEILVGDIVSFQVYIGMMIWPVMMVGDMVLVVQQGKVAIKRILEVIHYSDGIEEDTMTPCSHFESLQLKDFNFTYPNEENPTLKHLSLTVKAGQTIGVVGMTGSGKTTFLKQWLHQYPYQGEKIILNGKPITHWSQQSVAQLIAYVPQEHTLFSRSIRENLYIGSGKVDDDQLWQVLERASMAEDVKRMPKGLSTLIGEKGVTLSGGQKQRLSIARALLRESEVLLLDDALSAVDAKTEQEIIAHLKQTRITKTNIITAHRLSAVRHADIILVFDRGEIVDYGTHDRLLEHRGWYYEQYLKQELEESY